MSGLAKLKVSRSAAGLVMRLEGRATMQESPAFCQYAVAYLEQRSGTLYIDLRSCTYLDSTFLGCLVQLHRRFDGTEEPDRVVLVGSPEGCERLFTSARLQHLFTVIEEPPPALEEARALPLDAPQSDQLGRHVMECHRELAQLAGPHQAVFKSIADQLARELEK